MPQVAARAITLLQEPDVSLESVGALIRQDPALVADVIRLSNSALFGRGEPCVGLDHALQRLGLEEVLRAIGLSLSQHLFGKPLTNYGLTSAQYWRASLLAAILMEQLADANGIDAPEAYTIGILHALGRVLIDEVLGEEENRAGWDRSTSLENWEVRQVGFTHAEAGALLLRGWKFPSAIVLPIENQLGSPTVVSAQSTVGMLRFVRVVVSADQEASTLPKPAPLPPDLLQWAGFASVDEVADLLRDAQARLAVVEASLGMAQAAAASAGMNPPEG
jgi:HD-like signal output (HDOD) protein